MISWEHSNQKCSTKLNDFRCSLNDLSIVVERLGLCCVHVTVCTCVCDCVCVCVYDCVCVCVCVCVCELSVSCGIKVPGKKMFTSKLQCNYLKKEGGSGHA